MSTDLTLELINPTGEIANYVQAIWFAQSHKCGETWLPSDGATGFIFPLRGLVSFNDNQLTAPFYLQPIAIQSSKVSYSEQACFFGIRFKPAGLAFLKTLQHPIANPKNILPLLNTLQKSSANLTALLQLLEPILNMPIPRHNSILHTQTLLEHIVSMTPLEQAYAQTPIGKRQLERQVKIHCGITPKHLARIYRVRLAKQKLRETPDINIAQLALDCGYADQSHLIREFKTIFQITPAKYTKRLKAADTTLPTAR
ncbi:helix-turn-helix domain-containing protein [Pseudoalteromonas sp. M8]|uniref:AraC family transcriptional regulator n=1 Tax=Pseudoalteromonas sp. M8 TaxID=2692624 RepID=UPI001BAD00B8|nr:helix-turn-helix domain-containing protein [Pseudoalteromonas sp. M8]QUI70722.1 helix-turn-helix domain-containing protein [Pseudoalteromonas sp. M8]